MGKPTFCFSPVWHFTGETLLRWKSFFFKTGNTTFGDEQLYCYFFCVFSFFCCFWEKSIIAFEEKSGDANERSFVRVQLGLSFKQPNST